MKYLPIYIQMMEKEVAEVIAGKNNISSPQKTLEWQMIGVVLKNPDLDNKQLMKAFSKEVRLVISEDEFSQILKAVRLEFIDKRKAIVRNVKKNVKIFKSLLEGDVKAAKKFGYFMGSSLRARYFMTYLQLFEEEFKVEQGEQVIENCASHVLKKIYGELCKKVGYKKTVKDMIANAEQTLKERHMQSYEECGKESELEKIERLEFEIDNYKNTLELVQSMFDALKDGVEESAKEAKEIAVSEFFTSLNAIEYGSILDSMVRVEASLAIIREQQIKLPPQVQPLVIIFKQLNRFIKEYGILPIEEQGRILKVTYDDIAELNYQGEAFVDDGEVKEVEVVAPGWKYGETIISLPTIREK